MTKIGVQGVVFKGFVKDCFLKVYAIQEQCSFFLVSFYFKISILLDLFSISSFLFMLTLRLIFDIAVLTIHTYIYIYYVV